MFPRVGTPAKQKTIQRNRFGIQMRGYIVVLLKFTQTQLSQSYMFFSAKCVLRVISAERGVTVCSRWCGICLNYVLPVYF